MLRKTLLILTTFILFSCNGNNTIEKVTNFENGNKKMVRTYEIIDGKEVLIAEKQFYETGELKIEGKYSNEERHGIWKSYFKNGNLWSQATYIRGRENGEKIVNYEDGTLYYKGEILNDNRVGKWTFVGIDGKESYIDYDKRNAN